MSAAEPRIVCICGDSVRRSMVPAHIVTNHARHVKRTLKNHTDELLVQLDVPEVTLVFFEDCKEWLVLSLLPHERAWVAVLWASADWMLKVDNATSLIYLRACAQNIVTQTNDDSLFMRLRLFRAADFLRR